MPTKSRYGKLTRPLPMTRTRKRTFTEPRKLPILTNNACAALALLCAGNERMSLTAWIYVKWLAGSGAPCRPVISRRDIVFVCTHFYRSVRSVFDEVQDYDERQ